MGSSQRGLGQVGSISWSPHDLDRWGWGPWGQTPHRLLYHEPSDSLPPRSPLLVSPDFQPSSETSAPQAQHSCIWQLRFWEPPGPCCLEQPFFLRSLFFGQKTKWSSWIPWPKSVRGGEQKVWAGDHRHSKFQPQFSSSVKREQLGFCFIVLLWGLNEIILHIKSIANPQYMGL